MSRGRGPGLWLVLAATGGALLQPEAARGGPASLGVTGLRCEQQRDPLGIDERRPRLGWLLESEERDQAQTAYRVLVASSRERLDRDEGDAWDSGRVAGAGSVEIAYAGRPLASRTVYHWKVRVWDRRGRPSPWSAPARWETALLDPAEWVARWVNDGRPNPTRDEAFYDDDPAPLFRREFELPAAVVRARLYVTGLGYYEASLNGARVGDRVLDPGWTMYGKRVYYSTYDVTAQLRRGGNCLGITLGNGWYNPLPLRMWGRLNLREHLVVGRPRFVAQLEAELADGSRRVVASDTAWRVAEGPLRRNSVYLGERYDARREVPGWDRPGFDDRSWRSASLATEPLGPLQAQPQPPIRVADALQAVAMTEPARGVYVFDLGENFAGWARLRLRAPAGTAVTLRYGELVRPDGTLNPLTSVAGQVKGLRRGTAEPIGGPGAPEFAVQTDTYVARGGAEETWTPRFGFRGFRYVEVSGLPGAPERDAITGVRLHPDLEETGSFESSSRLLNRVHAMTRRTFLSNLFSVQSDCPHREKFAYGGDIVATSDALMLGFDMARFYEKAVVDWADSARGDGMLTDTAPFVGIQYCGIGWAMVHPRLQWQLHQHYGNRRLIERQYETARRWLDLVAAGSPDHVVREGLGDHEALVETAPEALLVPLFHESATLVSRLARVIGREAEAARYAALAEAIRGTFAGSAAGAPPSRPATQSAAAFALHFALVPEPERPATLAWLLDDVRTARGGHLSTGILGTKLALDVLSREGHAQPAFDVVRQEGFPGWGHMLASGATTLWEHWAGSDDTYSHNHPMFGSVSQWMVNWLGGIQPDPDAVGFDRVVLRPQPVDGLEWVRSSYRSARGPVVSSWSRAGDVFSWDVAIPPGTTATAFVPARSLEEVLEGREGVVPASRAAGVREARMDGAAAVLRLGSGRYRFVSRLPGH